MFTGELNTSSSFSPQKPEPPSQEVSELESRIEGVRRSMRTRGTLTLSLSFSPPWRRAIALTRFTCDGVASGISKAAGGFSVFAFSTVFTFGVEVVAGLTFDPPLGAGLAFTALLPDLLTIALDFVPDILDAQRLDRIPGVGTRENFGTGG